MNATTNFLTAPAPAQRGNDVLANPLGGEESASGAQFAGVLNGQMLKLERQALASPPPESADLQVLRLGNKLNVITTDAPLPDVASLADFARAQGLGESAVQALFGSAASTIASISATLSFGTGTPSPASELPDSGNPQAAQALAQTAATSLIELALNATGPVAMTSENWLGQRSVVAGTADAVDAFKSNGPDVAPAPGTDTLSQLSALYALRTRGLVNVAGVDAAALRTQILVTGAATAALSQDAMRTQILVTGAATAALSQDAMRTPMLVTGAATAALSQDAMRTLGPANDEATATTDGANPLEVQGTEAAPVALSADAMAAAALAAAVQAGLGLAPLQQAPALDESPVTVTSLSIEKPESSQSVGLVNTSAASLAVVQVISKLSGPEGLAVVGEKAPDQPQADLQIRLVPPDQAITQRLAQMTGKSKPIDWSALLAGQKVSDTLVGLAQSPAVAMSDAQAKLVAQMQANGQLPPSGDEARNALLAKLQVQAASSGASPGGFGAPAGTQAWASAATPQLATGASQFASQSTSAASLIANNDKAQTKLSFPVMQATGAAQTLEPALASRLWESVRIAVPSGLVLEALEEHQAQKSDAEPSLPASPSATAGPASNLSHSLASDKAQVSTPQALAEQRAAQYQEVADQLGEAMARRLMAQIERGQWKMQLRMQPAALGRIDVELDMHAKGLDATFTSDNAVTRELMAQGSARLRDTLTQTGTTVASVVVNGDSGRQSGGNSTPGQKPKSGQNADNKKTAQQALVQTATMPSTAQGDGLNVLA